MNRTHAGPPTRGSLPDLAFYNSTSGEVQASTAETGDPGLSSQPYTAVEGYQTHGTNQAIKNVYTDIVLQGTASSLGSSIASGGLNVHIPDSTYSVDYLVQLYAYFQSNGYASISYAFYSACAGVGFACGPAYGNCNVLDCPTESITITSGTWTDIGEAGQSIELDVRWTSTYGWVLDYRDEASNPSSCETCWWTVVTLYPSGTYSTMKDTMNLGEESTAFNAPVYTAYFFQVGFTWSSIPENDNWQLDAYNTRYVPQASSSWTWLNHAESIEFCDLLRCSPAGYFDFWKEVWTVSEVAGENQGISFAGNGNSTYNEVYVWYSGNAEGAGGEVTFW